MDERWDTVQEAYLSHLVEKHGIPILALHTPLHGGVWRLDPDETLVPSAKLAYRIGAPLVVVHPLSPGRPLARWAAGPLERARGEVVHIAVENMPRDRPRHAFSIRRNLSCHLAEHLYGIGGVTLDKGHVGASSSDLMQVYGELARQLCHVHLSDSELTGGNQHRLPGRGKLPLAELLDALERDDYHGAVSLEVKPGPLGAPDPDEYPGTYARALEFTREGLGS
jgi:sugar phosphate isomerase/epimerase